MITPCPECKQDLNSASPSCRHPKRHVSQTTPPDSGELRLRWYQRDDGLWNADCACRGTLAGWEESERRGAERWHWMDAKARNDGTIIRPEDHGPVPPDSPVSIPLPLAQRILAALEDIDTQEVRAIRAELRARLLR